MICILRFAAQCMMVCGLSWLCIDAQHRATRAEIVDYYGNIENRIFFSKEDAFTRISPLVSDVTLRDFTLQRACTKTFHRDLGVSEVRLPGMGFYEIICGSLEESSLVYYPPGAWVDFYINTGPAYLLELVSGDALVVSFFKKKDVVETDGRGIVNYAANHVTYIVYDAEENADEQIAISHNVFYAVVAGKQGLVAVRSATTETYERQCPSLSVIAAIKERCW